MRLNTLFTTGLIVTLAISLACCLKRQKNFLCCWIPSGRTIGSSRYVPNCLFSFWYPGSLITPTRSSVGSDYTCFGRFRHALVNVSGRHVSDGSALARFLLFSIWLVQQMWSSSFLCNGPERPSLDTI